MLEIGLATEAKQDNILTAVNTFKGIIPYGYKLITKAGVSTFTVPEGVTRVWVSGVGGGAGGGGGSSYNSTSYGGGGGAGAFGFRIPFTVKPNQEITVTVGGGGVGGAAGGVGLVGGTGGNGGASSFGNLLTLGGGNGGTGALGNSNGAVGNGGVFRTNVVVLGTSSNYYSEHTMLFSKCGSKGSIGSSATAATTFPGTQTPSNEAERLLIQIRSILVFLADTTAIFTKGDGGKGGVGSGNSGNSGNSGFMLIEWGGIVQ